MFSEAELNRYNRHLIMPEIGREGQEKLKQARVLVVGAGGLGCPVLQYLAAAGIGNIGIIDPDVVDESNLQRQVLYTTNDIGKSKAITAADRMQKLNPEIKITPIVSSLHPGNALELIRDYDIIIDGSDNFSTRYLVNDACVVLNKPFISGAIHKFEAQISVFNYQGGPTYRCLYPEPGDLPSCAEAGVLGVLPGVAGCILANEAIKVIIGKGEVLTGKLLLMNLLSMQFNVFVFKLNPENMQVKVLDSYDFFCDTAIREITAAALKGKMQNKEDFQLIDVREAAEYESKNIGGELIPLSELLLNLHRIAKHKPVVIHCQTGARSKKAISMLEAEGFTNLYQLQNGLKDF